MNQFAFLVFVLIAVVGMIGIAIQLAKFLVQSITEAFVPPDSTEKPKREGVSYFEAPTEEPDYVVGFGDDGELIYASEKPKRKNDEVV